MSETREPGVLLFSLSGQADADNISPAIWSTARDGTTVHVWAADAEIIRSLQNAWWAKDCMNLTVRSVFPWGKRGTLKERLGRIRWNRWRLRREFRRQGIQLVAMQWTEGVSYPATSLLRSIVRYWFGDLPSQLQLAAHGMDIPTVALPHGHSTKTTIIRSPHVREKMADNLGKLPFANRDSHTAYVFASEYHRKVIVENSTMSGENTTVWGSARFNDLWVAHLYGATTAAALPRLDESQMRRVLFFIPKWNNLVDRPATIDLICALGQMSSIQLVLRGHLRADDAALNIVEHTRIRNTKTVMVGENVSSASLIQACDVVVDVDSSIAFDAILLGKPYVRPRYLQDATVQTVWDELGGAHQTASCDETVVLLSKIVLLPAERQSNFDEVVFGGKGESVLARYRDELLRLAGRR